MDYRDVPAFMVELGQIDTVAAAGLRFVILTAARTGEVIGARWNEIDWNERTWTVPSTRAKTKMQHVVPLSTGALAVLRGIEPLRNSDDGFIFPGRDGFGQSSMTLLVLLQRRMKRAVTTHGFRSAFRDWCGDEGDVPRELAEASLAHVIKNQVERAYRRRSAVERRRAVMQSWCDFCLPATSPEIVNIAAARRGRASAA
jgi:integrase